MKTIRGQPCPEPPSPDHKADGEESLLDRERFCKRGLTVRRGPEGRAVSFPSGGCLLCVNPSDQTELRLPESPPWRCVVREGHGETCVGFGG